MRTKPTLMLLLALALPGALLAGCAAPSQLGQDDRQRIAGRTFVVTGASSGLGRGTGVGRQVEELRAGGARVALVTPDHDAIAAIGRNVLDPARRAGSARAGRAQAAAVADTVRDVWGRS